MAISSINNSYDYNKNVTNKTDTKKTNTEASANKDVTAETTNKSKSAVVYQKSDESKGYDKAKIQQMLKENDNQMNNFKKLVDSILSKQSNKIHSAMPSSNLKNFFSSLEVDDATRKKAQEDISETGYWGVDQTAGRLLDFAKAVAGDDPKKLEEMRTAVQKGFDKAAKMWGDKLPDISQRTYDKVMSGFDEWKSSLEK